MSENVESQEPIENEPVVEPVIDDPKAEEVEPVEGDQEAEPEDFDVVLEGEEEPTPQTGKMPKRVKKLLERNSVLQSDMETQAQSNAQEIERLKRELQASKAPQAPVISGSMPMPPTEDEHDYDPEKLAIAKVKYQQDMATWMQQQQQTQSQQQAATTAQNQRAQQEQTALESHYERADKLKVSDYDANEASAVENLGKDLVKSIAVALPNSAMIINYLGKNKAVAQEIADLNITNPNAGVAKLWELNFKLKAVPRKKSNAPEPETRVEGGGGGSVSALQKKFDAAADKGDITAFRRIKKEAKAKGITLN